MERRVYIGLCSEAYAAVLISFIAFIQLSLFPIAFRLQGILTACVILTELLIIFKLLGCRNGIQCSRYNGMITYNREVI